MIVPDAPTPELKMLQEHISEISAGIGFIFAGLAVRHQQAQDQIREEIRSLGWEKALKDFDDLNQRLATQPDSVNGEEVTAFLETLSPERLCSFASNIIAANQDLVDQMVKEKEVIFPKTSFQKNLKAWVENPDLKLGEATGYKDVSETISRFDQRAAWLVQQHKQSISTSFQRNMKINARANLVTLRQQLGHIHELFSGLLEKLKFL